MGENYKKKLVSNFAALSVIQGANFVLPIIVMPFVIRKIGADRFGLVSVAQVVMIFLATLADYGFNLTATRDVALYKGDIQRTSRIFFTVLASKFILCACTGVLLLGLIRFVPFIRDNYILYLLGFTYVIGQSSLASWFFQGMEKMQYITATTLFARLIFVILVFTFIRHRGDEILFLLFLGIGNIIAGLFSIHLAFRMFGLRWFRPLWSDILTELKEGWQVTVSNLSINAYQYINVLVLRAFTNDLIVGYYSIAEKIFFALRQILGIFSQVIYPRVCQLAIKGKRQVSGFLKDFYLPFLLLVTLGCIVVFIFSSWIVHLFLNSPPDLPILLLRILAFVPVIVCLNIPAYQILLAFNHKRSYLRILAGATLVNLAANLLLCNAWGPVGTALSIIVTELFVTIGLNLELYKNNLSAFINPGSI
ncbi:MAG TPA: oligosaccharide flippase family protein [Puia sp.]|nr:oligosaccharide flippase family protein [Puia sp.]